MNRDEIIREVIDLLEQHLGGTRGAMDQEPYKGDFFKLFKEAYRQGLMEPGGQRMLTADALSGVLAERFFTEDSQDDKRRDLMEQLYIKWAEWRYAWDHYEPH